MAAPLPPGVALGVLTPAGGSLSLKQDNKTTVVTMHPCPEALANGMPTNYRYLRNGNVKEYLQTLGTSIVERDVSWGVFVGACNAILTTKFSLQYILEASAIHEIPSSEIQIAEGTNHVAIGYGFISIMIFHALNNKSSFDLLKENKRFVQYTLAVPAGFMVDLRRIPVITRELVDVARAVLVQCDYIEAIGRAVASTKIPANTTRYLPLKGAVMNALRGVAMSNYKFKATGAQLMSERAHLDDEALRAHTAFRAEETRVTRLGYDPMFVGLMPSFRTTLNDPAQHGLILAIGAYTEKYNRRAKFDDTQVATRTEAVHTVDRTRADDYVTRVLGHASADGGTTRHPGDHPIFAAAEKNDGDDDTELEDSPARYGINAYKHADAAANPAGIRDAKRGRSGEEHADDSHYE